MRRSDPGHELRGCRPAHPLFLLLALLCAAGARIPAASAALPPSAERLHPPLDHPPLLSATFMEYRGSRLHAGIDLKTAGRIGFPVRAPFDGSVTKIYVDENSAGRLLEITRADGLAVRFAHLDSFDEKRLGLESRLFEARRGSGARYPADLPFPPGRIPVKRGEVVAVSGDTGAGPPHLHFETRRGGRLENPLAFFPEISDGTAPVIVSVRLAPIGPESRVAGLPVPFEWDFASGDAPPIPARGRVAITVNAYDRIGRSPNKVALHGFHVTRDGGTIRRLRCDSFDVEDRHTSDRIFDPEVSTLSEYHYRAATGPVAIDRPARFRFEASDRAGNVTAAELLLSPEAKAIAPRAGAAAKGGAASRGIDLDVRDGALRIAYFDPKCKAARLLSPADAVMDRIAEGRFVAALPESALPAGTSELVLEAETGDRAPPRRVTLVCAVSRESSGTLLSPDGRARLGWNAGALSGSGVVILFDRPVPAGVPLAPGETRAVALRPRTLRGGAFRLALEATGTGKGKGVLLGRIDGGVAWLPTHGAEEGTPRALVGGGDYAPLSDLVPPAVKGPAKRSVPLPKLETYAAFRLTDKGSGVPRENIRVRVDGAARAFDRFTESGVLRIPFTRDDAAGPHSYEIEATDLAGNRTVTRGEILLSAARRNPPDDGGKPKPEKKKPRGAKHPARGGKPGVK